MLASRAVLLRNAGREGCGTSLSPQPPDWRLRDAEWADRPTDFGVRIEHLPATGPGRLLSYLKRGGLGVPAASTVTAQAGVGSAPFVG